MLVKNAFRNLQKKKIVNRQLNSSNLKFRTIVAESRRGRRLWGGESSLSDRQPSQTQPSTRTVHRSVNLFFSLFLILLKTFIDFFIFFTLLEVRYYWFYNDCWCRYTNTKVLKKSPVNLSRGVRIRIRIKNLKVHGFKSRSNRLKEYMFYPVIFSQTKDLDIDM